MAIADADWHVLDRALDQLLSLDSGKQEQQLRQIESEDPEQARTLRRLLASLETADPIEALAESTVFAEALGSAINLRPGSSVGEWIVIERLGQGGMAEVYRAERQISGVAQAAALKIMSLGVGGEQALARFQQETAILARLQDPRLSRLIDAGRMADGRPWLAMEYVDGEPIDLACDRRCLSIRERVELIIEIGQALDHAHRHLIIHRDLKPANILLDRSGRPRVLDFGIAKLVDPLEADADRTATIHRAYTLRFASPEQLTGAPTGVASDVFQLGLLLHLLLSGKRAFSGHDDRPLELLQAIRSGARLPSRLWSESDQMLARARRSSPVRLRRQLNGDLDSIMLRALEAEPGNRYPGVRELVDDLQRWLTGAAVNARSGSRHYLARRWIRRHRVALAAAALAMLTVGGYAYTLIKQRDQLELERNRTEAVLDSLTEMFSAADPYAEDAESITVAEVVRETADRLLQTPASDPQVQAALLERLSELAESSRDSQRQISLLQAAHQLVQQHQLDPDWAARLMLNVAQAQAAAGDFHSAQRSLDAASTGLGRDDRYSARLFAAQLQAEAGEPEAASAAMLALLAELPEGPQHAARLANTHNSLAMILGAQGKLAESAEHYRLALATAPRDKPADDDLIGTIRSNLAVTLARQRNYAEAEQAFVDVLRWREQTLGPTHPAVANAASVYSPLLVRTHRFQTAWALLNRYRHPRREGVPNGYRWPDYLVNLSRAGFYSGHELTAVEATIEAAQALRTQVPENSPRLRRVYDYLAWWLFELDEQTLSLELARAVDPGDDQAPWQSRLILLLEASAGLHEDQRQALVAVVQASPCSRIELTVLQRALAGERDFAQTELPAVCEGPEAARLSQLGVRWQPDWLGTIQPEPYSSPLARRLLDQGGVPRLSEASKRAIRELLSPQG